MKEIIKSSFLSTLVTLLVLGLLQPFGIDQLKEDRLPFILGQGVCVFVCLILVNLLFVTFFPKLSDYNGKSLGKLILMLLPPFLVVSLVLGAVILSYDCWFQWDDISCGWIDEQGHWMWWPYFSVLGQVVIISLFVYIWMVYQVRNQSLNDELMELKALNKLLEERQEKDVAEVAEPEVTEDPKTCVLESATNNLTLEVNPKDIVYIESMSNYADICHVVDGETKHTTLRITMKQLRESLAEVECLVSCHRAFIVNLDFIVSISSRPSGGYQLQIFGSDKLIPVARSYTEEIKSKMK